MIHPERVKVLSRGGFDHGRFVFYWMQQAQRAECNHALEYAVRAANERDLPLAVFFGLTDDYPNANLRHYDFLVRGPLETRTALAERGIRLVLQPVSPERGVFEAAREAALVVTDRGYTRVQRQWRARAAARLECPLVQVETDVIVPLETVSLKEEYAAATIRPKILRQLRRFLVPLRETPLRRDSLNLPFVEDGLPADAAAILARLPVDRSVPPVTAFAPGASAAKQRLADFLAHKLRHYHEARNDPTADATSHLSPYLHFGQISPLDVALAVTQTGASPGAAVFLEELIVRRELAMNFAQYNEAYDRLGCLPEWAQRTLAAHRKDKRAYAYTRREWEQARTHDPYWNAAQLELVRTGKMHGYMRMYWGKKLIEWTRDPAEAFRFAVELNDKYALDGRDPNGYAGVAWCFGKHDRPWAERAVFGKVRYMNAAGLRRKFDIDDYVRRVNLLNQ
jgi:deoxyribodipyrimidine photo-lyase